MRTATELARASSRRTGQPNPIDPVLVEETVRACCDEAEHALDDAVAVLATNGLLDGRSIPLKLLLKLAACLRLRDWEHAGVAQLIRPPLPSYQEAWKDFVAGPLNGHGRYPNLAERVFGVRLWHGAWRPPGVRADVMVSNVSANDVVDDLANLLFQFRQLVDEHRPSGLEENHNG